MFSKILVNSHLCDHNSGYVKLKTCETKKGNAIFSTKKKIMKTVVLIRKLLIVLHLKILHTVCGNP